MDLNLKFQEVQESGNLLKNPESQFQALEYFEQLVNYPQIIELCLYTIANSNQELVQFHMANILKLSLPIQIANFNNDKFESLNNSIYKLLYQPNIPPHCHNQLIEAFCVLTKLRGCRTSLNEIASTINSSLLNIQEYSQNIHLDLSVGFLNEFNATTCSSINLSMDLHLSCHRWFQGSYIPSLMNQVLYQLHQSSNQSYQIMTIRKLLSILIKIFDWKFNIDQDIHHQDISNTSNILPTEFTQIINVEDFYSSLTKIYIQSLEDFNIRNDIEQIFKRLCQLDEASFLGIEPYTVFHNYVVRFLDQIYINISLMDYPSTMINVCEMAYNLIDCSSIINISHIQSISILLNHCANTTMMCLEHCDFNDENSNFEESLKLLFQLWSTMITKLETLKYYSKYNDTKHLEKVKLNELTDFLSEIAPSIIFEFFEIMIKQATNPSYHLFYTNFSSFDSELLNNVTSLARCNLETILPNLCLSFEQAVTFFSQSDFNILSQQSNEEYHDPQVYISIRKIECLIFIFGYIFTNYEEGEFCKILPSIQEYSASQINNNLDLVVAAPLEILKFGSFICSHPQFNIKIGDSFITDNILWFMNRWAQVFLLANPDDYDSLSSNILHSFGSSPLGNQCEFVIKTIIEMCFSIFKYNQFNNYTKSICLANLSRLTNKSAFFNQVKSSDLYLQFLQILLDNLRHYPSHFQRSITAFLLLPNNLQLNPSNLIDSVNSHIENQIQNLLNSIPAENSSGQCLEAISTYNILIGFASAMDFDSFDSYFSIHQAKFSAHIQMIKKFSINIEVWLESFEWINQLINKMDSFGDNYNQLELLLNFVHSNIDAFLFNTTSFNHNELDEEIDVITVIQTLQNIVHLENTFKNINAIEEDSDVVPRSVFEIFFKLFNFINESKLQSFEVQRDISKFTNLLVTSYRHSISQLNINQLERLYMILQYGTENFLPDFSFLTLSTVKELVVILSKLTLDSPSHPVLETIFKDNLNLIVNNKLNYHSLNDVVDIFSILVIRYKDLFLRLLGNITSNMNMDSRLKIENMTNILFESIASINNNNPIINNDIDQFTQIKPIIISYTLTLKSSLFLK